MGRKKTNFGEEHRRRRIAKRLAGAPKTKGQKVLDVIVDNICYIFGSSLYAAAVIAFAVPNNIAQSGATGLAIIFNHLFGVPIGVANMAINIPLLILAWIFIGWRFVAKTMWVTLILSALLDVFDTFLPVYIGDRLLAAIFCGVLSGLGLSIVFMRGATTGGTDIVGRLLRKRWPHVSMGKVILAADAFVVLLAAIVLKSVESALYAVIVIFVNSRMIDYVLYGTGSGKMLMVVTEKSKELSAAITTEMGRGVTILPVQGGYTGQEKNMLVCAVRNSEVSRLTKLIWSVDDKTFIIVSEAGEILGEGFKGRVV